MTTPLVHASMGAPRRIAQKILYLSRRRAASTEQTNSNADDDFQQEAPPTQATGKRAQVRRSSRNNLLHQTVEDNQAQLSPEPAATDEPPRRKTRGRTIRADIWNRQPGDELPELFNCYNQCIDKGDLSSFCGTIARNTNITPLRYHDWRRVPLPIKDEIWRLVKSKFNLSPPRRKWVLRQVSRSLRDFKCKLYKDNYMKYRSNAELKANVDPRTTQSEWEALVERWSSQAWKKKSETNRASRKLMKLLHTSGTISFPRRREMEYRSTGRRLTRVELFLRYHRRRNGTSLTPEIDEFLNRVENEEALRTDQEEEEEDCNLSNDSLSKVFGPDKNGFVRAMGFGVSPSTFSKENGDVRSEILKERNEARHEVGRLKDQVGQLVGILGKFINSTNSNFLQQVPEAQAFLSSYSSNSDDRSA